MTRWLGWTVFGVSVVGAMAWASIANADGEWQALCNWAMRVSVQASGRPALGGGGGSAGGGSGDAWHELRSAAAAVEAWPTGLDLQIEAAVRSPQQAPAALLATTSAAVGAVRAAAKCGIEGPGACDVLPLLQAFAAVQLAARGTAGDDADAALGMVAEGIAAAATVWSAGVGIQQLGGAHGLAALVDEVADAWLRRASPDALDRFAATLAACDAAVPQPADYLLRTCAQQVFEVATCRDIDDLGIPAPQAWRLWRTGFSTLGYVQGELAALAHAMHATLDATARPETPWQDRRAALAAMDRWSGAAPRVVGLGPALSAERELREALARLRLLRLAVAFHRGQELPELWDPLGEGALQATANGEDAAGLLLASADADVRRFVR